MTVGLLLEWEVVEQRKAAIAAETRRKEEQTRRKEEGAREERELKELRRRNAELQQELESDSLWKKG